MTKQELIDDNKILDERINQWKGIPPKGFDGYSINDSHFSIDFILKRARELGWVNGSKPKAEPLENPEQLDGSWFPPHDTDCEYSDYDFEGWRKCKYIGINTHGSKRFAVLFDPEKFIYVNSKISSELKFRPLKSEREKFIDACIASLSEFKSANQVFGELYDKGFRAPEDK